MEDNNFKWTDELVLLALDYAHYNGYHKFSQRCVDIFDEVKNQAMHGGYSQFPKWITEHLQKQNRQPLFTTADGKEIYEGDTVHKVTKDWQHHYFYAHKDHSELKSETPKFSSETLAKDYILMNKPCLSLNDLKKAINICQWYDYNQKEQAMYVCGFEYHAKELVKSKLNQ